MRSPQDVKDMDKKQTQRVTEVDWSLNREFWVPVEDHRLGGPTFGCVRRLLNWLDRQGYDGCRTVFEVYALNPASDPEAPVWVVVPKEVVDQWMGVA